MARKLAEYPLKKLCEWEGLRLKAYKDSVGVWTIGYGHTKGVFEGQIITQTRAIELLMEDVEWACETVERSVKVHLTDNQFGALVSFCFNVGAGAFAGSQLVKKLNKGLYNEVPTELMKWTKGTINGRKVNISGLVNRRSAECGLWSKGDFVSSNNVEVTPAAPKVATANKVGLSLTAVGTAASTAASQISGFADYSPYIKWAFIALTCVGVAISLYSAITHATEGAA